MSKLKPKVNIVHFRDVVAGVLRLLMFRQGNVHMKINAEMFNRQVLFDIHGTRRWG